MSTKTKIKTQSTDVNIAFNRQYAQKQLDDNVASIKAKLKELGYTDEYTNYIMNKILLTRKVDKYRRILGWFPTPQDWGWKPCVFEIYSGELRAYSFQLSSFSDFAMPTKIEACRFATDNAELLKEIEIFEQQL